MVLTPSQMPRLGTPVPSFRLVDVTNGAVVSPDDFARKRALLVIFLCNHCPFVVRIRDGLVRLGRDYEDSDVAIVGISANDPGAYPDDAPGKLADTAARLGYRFPVLFDEDQAVAKAFRAACTPDFFLYGPDRRLVYRGQFDDSRPGNDVAVTGKDLRAAIETVLGGGTPAADQKPSIGCNIKWRPGNEPDYFG